MALKSSRRKLVFFLAFIILFQLNVRGKNKKELFSGFLKTITKTADESLILSGQKVKIINLFEMKVLLSILL